MWQLVRERNDTRLICGARYRSENCIHCQLRPAKVGFVLPVPSFRNDPASCRLLLPGRTAPALTALSPHPMTAGGPSLSRPLPVCGVAYGHSDEDDVCTILALCMAQTSKLTCAKRVDNPGQFRTPMPFLGESKEAEGPRRRARWSKRIRYQWSLTWK